MARVREAFEFGAGRVLAPLGYELRDRALSERPEGFAGYLKAACAAGMDVNDYEEQRLGWRRCAQAVQPACCRLGLAHMTDRPVHIR